MQATLLLEASAARTVADATHKPAFVLRNLKVELIDIGSGAWTSGPSSFAAGPDGWDGAGNLQMTTCQEPIGKILGGRLTSETTSQVCECVCA